MTREYERQDLIEKALHEHEKIIAEKRSNHHRDKFFPMMINALDLRVGVEIGVDTGGFSEHIMSKTNMTMYYCVDTWQNDFGSDHKPDYYNRDGDIRLQQAQERLKKFIEEERVQMIRSTSLEASRMFEKNSIDFCYIDGDHSLDGIYIDLHCWVDRVKLGGLIAGHDYKDGPKSGINDYFGNQLPYRVKTVVDDFCRKHGYKLNVVGGRIMSWWFVKNKEREV